VDVGCVDCDGLYDVVVVVVVGIGVVVVVVVVGIGGIVVVEGGVVVVGCYLDGVMWNNHHVVGIAVVVVGRRRGMVRWNWRGWVISFDGFSCCWRGHFGCWRKM